MAAVTQLLAHGTFQKIDALYVRKIWYLHACRPLLPCLIFFDVPKDKLVLPYFIRERITKQLSLLHHISCDMVPEILVHVNHYCSREGEIVHCSFSCDCSHLG